MRLALSVQLASGNAVIVPYTATDANYREIKARPEPSLAAHR